MRGAGRHLIRLAALGLLVAAASAAQPAGARIVYVGSTPCDEPVCALLGIARDVGAELVQWELTLERAGDTSQAGRYHLRYQYGRTRANQPGLDADAPTLDRRGTWRIDTSAPKPAYAEIVRLDGSVSLAKVGATILHVLAADGTLMSGNGGWSYSLSRLDAVEPNVAAALVTADSGDPPRTTSRATGPTVLGIFDGRTPCQGVAREFGVTPRPGCWKAKWRLTLFHDPATQAPTTYRLEGTLYGAEPREGSWRVTRGAAAFAGADVLELGGANGGPPSFLLKADDRVLFFLDRQRRLLTGNARNAYTLDRVRWR